MPFKCDKCGLCCKSLKLMGKLYSDLDDGNGCCKYLNIKNNLCSIYEKRPLKCRIEEGYKVYFPSIPYELYIKKTEEGCKKLKEIWGQNKDGQNIV